jgi:hypothetical protein
MNAFEACAHMMRGELTEDDTARNNMWLRSVEEGALYDVPTFLDNQLVRARNIVLRHVTRPQFSKETRENIALLINELNRLDSAIKRFQS